MGREKAALFNLASKPLAVAQVSQYLLRPLSEPDSLPSNTKAPSNTVLQKTCFPKKCYTHMHVSLAISHFPAQSY